MYDEVLMSRDSAYDILNESENTIHSNISNIWKSTEIYVEEKVPKI